MRKHYEHGTTNGEQRLFKPTPKKFEPHTKLPSRDEFLMTRMKLRLCYFVTDLLTF